MSENRRIRRFLQRKGERKYDRTTYSDNIGMEYDYKFAAKLSSFNNIIMGGFRNGFPIAVKKLWYDAWAFYPFFFVKSTLRVKDPIPILNHERIHIRQQRDIHLAVSIPFMIMLLLLERFADVKTLHLLCVVPFIPTIIYGIEMLRSWRNLYLNNRKGGNIKAYDINFHSVRENTCFEREAISRATNADYLFTRKFGAVLAYTGWKLFQKYGMYE